MAPSGGVADFWYLRFTFDSAGQQEFIDGLLNGGKH
jgi:hypothetical protein